jgi:hypothetical protein
MAPSRTAAQSATPRRVLVELFTSQGCDMCPEAEAVLGRLAAKHGASVAPVALHVDYFDEPWKDVFSDPQHSRRQMSYNAAYRKPKHPEYGLYYTPMLMIDGMESVNGRDEAAASAAIDRASKRAPLVEIEPELTVHTGGRSAELRVELGATSARVRGRELVVGVVLREDGVTTNVDRGENAGKTLTARFPSRKTLFDIVKPSAPGKPKPPASRFALERPEGSRASHTAVVVFVQDKTTGHVYQAAELPWPTTSAAEPARPPDAPTAPATP